MNKLSRERRTQVIAALVEGNSIRSTCRMTGTAKGTVLRLLEDAGVACLAYQDAALRDLPCPRLQRDEIRSFCDTKQKHVPERHKGEFGYSNVWTWTAIRADTKLVPSVMVGDRTATTANAFMLDLAGRLRHRVQLTNDGRRPYLEAVEGAFGADIDHAMLIKLYGPDPSEERRHSPPVGIGASARIVASAPGPGGHLDQLRRAPEPHHAHGHAPLHPPDEHIQQEGAELGARRRAPLHARHLRPAAQDAARRHPGDGGRPDRAAVGDRGDRGTGRGARGAREQFRLTTTLA